MTQLPKCFRLNLTDSLTGYVKFLSNFFQCPGTPVIETETQAQNLLLPVCQGA